MITLVRAGERAAVARLALTILGHVRRSLREELGTRAPPYSGLIVLAVTLGHAEGRLMSAGDIATYVDMPRATTARHCDHLVRVGLLTRVRSRYSLSDTFANAPRRTGGFHQLLAHLRADIRTIS